MKLKALPSQAALFANRRRPVIMPSKVWRDVRRAANKRACRGRIAVLAG